MLELLFGFVVGGAVGCVVGLLVGRKNKKGVEVALDRAKQELAKAGINFK